MNTINLKSHLPTIITTLIGLFFIFVLHFKLSYSLIPILLAVMGLVLLFPSLKRRQWLQDSDDKRLFWCVLGYVVLFVASLIVHKGKMNELDLPSRLLLLLPVIAVIYRIKLRANWLLWSVVLATLIAGMVALIQVFGLKMPSPFPAHMYIQSGDIMMSLSLFSLAIAFYFRQQKQQRAFFISLLAVGFGLFASVINQARGAWVVAPFLIGLILWFNRQSLSKSIWTALLGIAVIGGGFAGHIIQQRVSVAASEIEHYVENHNGNTSVGARLDMWKSAMLGIQEKPLFGRGLQGVKIMRQQHKEQGIISAYAASFDHAHNQYLHDTSARGLFGFLALLAIFLVPLRYFWRTRHQGQLWATLGIVHILATMGYCLTQAFLSHNSGIMFYGFVLFVFYALQKNAQNQPLAGGR